MRHGAGQAPGRAQSPGDARLKVLGTETPDMGTRLWGHAGREDWEGMGGLGACVLGQEPKKRSGPTEPGAFKQPLCHPRLVTFPVCRLHLGKRG